MTFPRFSHRTASVATAAALLCAATGAGAAALHTYAVTQSSASGSLGATTFLQSDPTSAALQGEVATSPQTAIRIPFGVLGEYDAPGSTFGIGVVGISSTGYAVGGEAFGSNPAVLALNSSTGDGLDAFSHGNAPALFAESSGGGPGISAFSDEADGIDVSEQTDQTAALDSFDGSPDGGYGMFGETESPAGIATLGITQTGIGLYGESESGSVGSAALVTVTAQPGTELFSGEVVGSDSNVYESSTISFPSQNASGTVTNPVGATSDMQLNGDVLLTGGVFTHCTNFPETAPATDCDTLADSVARSNSGAMVQTYGAHHASPTMEDEGEARLVNGYAHVSLDPTYASMISMRSPYLVFTTPQGDGPGLFVSNRTATGFDVRQSQGGRSSMSFDYRIVAHQFGRESKRIAIVAPQRTQVRALPIGFTKRLKAIHAFHAHHMLRKHTAPRALISAASLR